MHLLSFTVSWGQKFGNFLARGLSRGCGQSCSDLTAGLGWRLCFQDAWQVGVGCRWVRDPQFSSHTCSPDSVAQGADSLRCRTHEAGMTSLQQPHTFASAVSSPIRSKVLSPAHLQGKAIRFHLLKKGASQCCSWETLVRLYINDALVKKKVKEFVVIFKNHCRAY